MRLILEIIIFVGVFSGGVLFFKWLTSTWKNYRINKFKREQEILQEVKKALESNSKVYLENALILYNNEIPKDIKSKIQLRIDDLIIKESDESLIQDLNKERTY